MASDINIVGIVVEKEQVQQPNTDMSKDARTLKAEADAQALRSIVIDRINNTNDALHLAGGVRITRTAPAKGQIQTLVRDATARKSDQKIDWIAAYQMRTLSFLMSAITLAEIHSEHAGSAEAVQQLDSLLSQITESSWSPEETAKENFSKHVKAMSLILKEKIGVTEKSFYYANGWVSMDLPPQTIETKSKMNGTNYIIRCEPICELTDEIKEEFARILQKDEKQWPIWYQKLDKDSKKLCQYYAGKIAKGELHQLTPGLRGLIPGLKNAYKTTLLREGENGTQNEELLSFYHTATVPMGSESLDAPENERLTKLGYRAMQQGAKGDVVAYTTLVSRHGDTIQQGLLTVKTGHVQFRNLLYKENKELPKPGEFIDHVINDFSKSAAESLQKEGLPFYHSNVCLNGARRFERSKVQGLNQVLFFIEEKINACADDTLKAELLKQLITARKEVDDLSTQIQTLASGDEEMRAYKSLFTFAKLIHNYNQSDKINQGQEIRWYFGCASGQNRTQALAYSLIHQRIREDQKYLKKNQELSQLEENEIATRLAEDGPFTYINGPYDWKFGIRSKSAGSFPKSLFRQVQSMILSLADTKRPGDVLYQPKKVDDFFAELNKKSALSSEKLSSIWSKYVHGKSGIALNDEALVELLAELRELNQRYQELGISDNDNKYAKLLVLAFQDQCLEFFFCQDGNKYKEVFGIIQSFYNARKILEPQQLSDFIKGVFVSINKRKDRTLMVDEVYQLVRTVFPDEKGIIDRAFDSYKKEPQISRGNVADSEREESQVDWRLSNGSSLFLAQEEIQIATIGTAIQSATNLAEVERLVEKERRLISSLLADGHIDLAYNLADALVDSTISLDLVQNNEPLLNALNNLKQQVSLPQEEDNKDNKKLATKALLLVSEEVLNCAQYVSEPKQADVKNKEYKPIITSDKMREIVGKSKAKKGFLSSWCDRIVGAVNTICEVLFGLDESRSLTPKHYQDNLLKGVLNYQGGIEQLVRKGAQRVEGVEAEAAIEAATGKTPLHSAVIESPDKVAQLIEKGADVNAKDFKGKTPLHYAIPGNCELVSLLIAKKADFDAKDMYGKTPLNYAVEYGDRETVRVLMNAGANANTCDAQDKTPRDYAVELKNADICNLLGVSVSDEVDSEQNPSFNEDAKFPFGDEAKAAMGKTQLHCALIESSAPDKVAELIKKDANVNAKDFHGKTPLHYVVEYENKNRAEILTILLNNGANVDAKDMYGKTPLNYAVEYGDTDTARILNEALMIKEASEELMRHTEETRNEPNARAVKGFEPQTPQPPRAKSPFLDRHRFFSSSNQQALSMQENSISPHSFLSHRPMQKTKG